MKLRQAWLSEICVGAEFIYQKNPGGCVPGAPTVVIHGFVSFDNGDRGTDWRGDPKNPTLCVIKKRNGQISLATDDQLFVRVG